MKFDAIYKYPIGWDKADIEMPSGAQVLTAQLNGDTLCLWAKVNTKNPPEKRRFVVATTGEGLPCVELEYGYGNFIATIQESSGYVCHVFELT